MASYAEQQAERQRIKAMQEKQRAKSAAAHQQRVDANAEAKRRQQQQTNQIRAQEAQQAQQQQRLRAQRESERRKNAAARQIEIEQARRNREYRIDPAIPDSAYDIPRESDMSYSARLKAHEKKVERARQEDARRARLGLEPLMYIPEFWNPPPKPGSIEALPIPLVPVVPREGQIRAKTVAPQQSRAAVVADETSASIGQGQQQTPTKPPPTAEDLEIARDKAQIQAREAQQKLDNPNVATPRNREYQDIENIEMQQRGTLGQRVLPALPPPSDEPRRRRRLQGEILEQQQQGTLGRQKWHALPPTEPIRPNPPSRIIEQQQLGTLGQTSRATMQSLQPDPRARYVGATKAAGSQQRGGSAKSYGVAGSDATRPGEGPYLTKDQWARLGEQRAASVEAGYPPSRGAETGMIHERSGRAEHEAILRETGYSRESVRKFDDLYGPGAADSVRRYGPSITTSHTTGQAQYARQQTNLARASRARVANAIVTYRIDELFAGSRSGIFAAQNLGGLTQDEALAAFQEKQRQEDEARRLDFARQ